MARPKKTVQERTLHGDGRRPEGHQVMSEHRTYFKAAPVEPVRKFSSLPPRTKPMKRSTKPIDTTSSRSRATARKLREWRKKHDGDLCAARPLEIDGCMGLATDPSHRRPRSLLGSHEESNLDAVCRICHDWIEANPNAARMAGFAEGTGDAYGED